MIDLIRKEGLVYDHVVGGFLFFRIEWKEHISIQGLVGDPIIRVTCPAKKRDELTLYLTSIFQKEG